MIGYFGASKWRESSKFQMLILLIIVGTVSSIDVSSLNNKESKDTVKSSDLKMEARNDDISNISQIPEATNNLTIYPVYPESRSNVEAKLSTNPSSSWKSAVKTSSKDSYLDALNHSHLNTYQPDVTKSKHTKLIRRNYETPVYRPTSLDIEISKEPKISVKPTQNSFLPTPSNSYSLPINSPTSFIEQNQYGTLESNNDYEVPQNNYGTPSQSYDAPSQSYGIPSQSYGTPSQSYEPSQMNYENVQNNYDTPSNSYGYPVNTAYGPPKSSYGPPAQQQAHAATSWSGYQLPSLPELPSLSNIALAWPLAIKLNAFTIAKIILKLVIFKMIVKFIAVMCLLLFIPKLKTKKQEKDDDDDRSVLSDDARTKKLNVLTAQVLESIEKYETKNGTIDDDESKCSSFNCRLRRLIGTGDTWNDYFKLFTSYAAEEDDEDDDDDDDDEEEEDEKTVDPPKTNLSEKKTV